MINQSAAHFFEVLAAAQKFNFCTSSVATANIPPSKIIGNQKKSGTAQLLEVGPPLKEVHCSAGFRDSVTVASKPLVSNLCAAVMVPSHNLVRNRIILGTFRQLEILQR